MRPLTAVFLHWSELISVGVLISLTQTQPKHHTLARRRGRTIQNSSVLLTLCLGDTILSLPGRVCLIKHLFIYLFICLWSTDVQFGSFWKTFRWTGNFVLVITLGSYCQVIKRISRVLDFSIQLHKIFLPIQALFFAQTVRLYLNQITVFSRM